MAREPGTLSDFEDAAQEDWDALLVDYFVFRRGKIV